MNVIYIKMTFTWGYCLKTNFPVGYSNSTGVRYCDPKDFKSPSNVWM